MAVPGYLMTKPTTIYSSIKIPTPKITSKRWFNLNVRASASSTSSAGGENGKVRITRKEEEKEWKVDFSGEKPITPLLDTINYPVHMKNLSSQDLEQLSAELRAEVVYSVSDTGGHLSSNLGVVELTIALHHVFNTPEDKIIWDVGHQSYPHKILTGRRSKMQTMRQTSGLAGFPKRDESIHDAFGVGHSSTSISAGLDGPLKLRAMVLPDRYIDHGSPQDQLEEAGLSSRHISATVLSVLERSKEALYFK